MKRILLLCALSGAVLIGATAGNQKVNDDQLVRDFLKEADRILSIDPDDGRFGLNRLPTLHGRQAFSSKDPVEKVADEKWDNLSERNFMAIASFGKFEDGVAKRKSTMSGYYQLNWAPFVKGKEYFDAENAFHNKYGPEGAAKLFASRKKELSVPIDYAGNKATLRFRAIFPSSDQCIPCHQDVDKGDPIGIVALIRIPKAPAK